jgi:hypothetical protein
MRDASSALAIIVQPLSDLEAAIAEMRAMLKQVVTVTAEVKSIAAQARGGRRG